MNPSMNTNTHSLVQKLMGCSNGCAKTAYAVATV